jgi:hypothetical protein
MRIFLPVAGPAGAVVAVVEEAGSEEGMGRPRPAGEKRAAMAPWAAQAVAEGKSRVPIWGRGLLRVELWGT